MFKKLFRRPRAVETEMKAPETSEIFLKSRELEVKILNEIDASNELNRVLNWFLSRGYRMECCFLIDGTVKFMLYYQGTLLKETIWAYIDKSGERQDITSPTAVVWDWIEKYY